MSKLVIVESPSKATTISKYLDKQFTVRASIGHVRDLPKSNKKAIDIDNGFKPHYETVKGKEKILDELHTLAGNSEEILLATDPDREGEAIAWHLKEALELKRPKRVVFHEITKDSVLNAIAHPRSIDKNLRTAQEARRVLDRLVGYDLSGLIWKKVRYGLSAGRVQSPSLRILMEREREIRAFETETFWVITAETKTPLGDDLILICKKEPREISDVNTILAAGRSNEWRIIEVREADAVRSPRPPFITSTLQQAASSRLGYSPSKTMSIAQKLYEAGYITYMRTDSTVLSSAALTQIHTMIKKKYGDVYLKPRTYKTSSKAAQEAHEAIRPTSVLAENRGRTAEQKKLYELIWTRTVSSQMTNAKLVKSRITARIENSDVPDFAATGSRVSFDGWLACDTSARGEDIELPKVSEKDVISLIQMQTDEKQTQPPPRYTEAGLVKELEKRGIGRPSTYASIMKTLIDRGYVTKEGRTLKPTETGDVVSTFLEKNFSDYISDSFTAEMENELDEIANGEREYSRTLKEFYTPFRKEVESKKDLEKITNMGDAPSEFRCPKCKSSMIFKLSKSGKFMSCSKFPDCTGARTREGEELEGIKEIGEKCPDCDDGHLVERDGRYGRFIACGRYPKCRYVREDPETAIKASTGVICTKCNKGEMIERRGRYGVFYGCSGYPACKHAIKAKPTGSHCKMCGELMMEGTKTIPERCSDKICPNHNPHKLVK
jgi:DNA topoisomerase I